jgi:hypothetical protein
VDNTARIMAVVATALGFGIAAKSFVRFLVSVDLSLTRNMMRFARMANLIRGVVHSQVHGILTKT